MMYMTRVSSCLLTLSAAITFGCSSEKQPTTIPVETIPAPMVETVSGAPTMPDDGPEASQYASMGYIVALGSLGSTTVVGTTVEASTVNEAALKTIEVWGEGPQSTGRVNAVLRRSDNVLVAAEQGVFHTLGDNLVLSPASDTLAALDIRALHLASGTQNEQIWIVAADGLYQLENDMLSKWNIDGADPANITAVLATASLVYIGFGGALYELDPALATAARIDLDFGMINRLLIGRDDVLQIATTQGLYERQDENNFVQYTLADGDAVRAIDDMVLDPKQGTFAVTDQGIVLAKGKMMPEGVKALPEQSAPRIMAYDDIGNVWVGDDQTLYGLPLGTPISFATDVAPLLGTYCMSCHGEPTAENTPAVNFEDYATAVEYAAAIVLRVGTGQMPPLGSEPVPSADFEVIKRWHEGGDNP